MFSKLETRLVNQLKGEKSFGSTENINLFGLIPKKKKYFRDHIQKLLPNRTQIVVDLWFFTHTSKWRRL